MNNDEGLANQSSEVRNGQTSELFIFRDGNFPYSQMMDESKQTEEADFSRSDFTETHSQDTMRNFQRMSDIKLTKQEILELKQIRV